MGPPPMELPPPPPPIPPSTPATQIVGQQSVPSTSVPVVPAGAMMTATGRRTNSAAVISLVSALLAPVGHCIGVGGITLIVISLVTGHMALAEIKRSGEDGSGYAVAGLIISYAHLVITALVVLFFFNLVVALFGFWLHLLFTH